MAKTPETIKTDVAESLISLIVPVYNVEPYLRECLDSIIEQTYTNIEVLIVDDGSTDHSGEICEEYALRDDRIRVFHTENSGLSAARNYGLDRAKGDYIAFFDSDDVTERDMMEKMMSAIMEYNADIAVCLIHEFWVNYESDSRESDAEAMIFEGDPLIEQAAKMDKILSYAWNKLFRSELFSEIRFPSGKLFEDSLTVYKAVLKSDRVVLLPDVLVRYRKRIGSLSNERSAKQVWDFWYAKYSKYEYFKNAGYQCTNYPYLLSGCFNAALNVMIYYYGFSEEEKTEFAELTGVIHAFCREHYDEVMRMTHLTVKERLLFPFLRRKNSFIFWILYRNKTLKNKISNNRRVLYP